MVNLVDPASMNEAFRVLQSWFTNNVLTLATLVQAIIIAAALLVSWLLTPKARTGLTRLSARFRFDARAKRGIKVLNLLMLPMIWLSLQWMTVLVATRAGWPSHLITAVVSLLTAWVVIRLGSRLIHDETWSRFVAVIAWTIAALNVVGWLDQAIAVLDSLAVNFGALRISVFTMLKAALALAVLLWAAVVASGMLERRISTSTTLTPSVQVLISKLFKATLFVVAVFVALSSVGIDLTVFAVFSGALGVGIGFGLQKVVSNLVSGVILLLDRSIKPGDVIGIGTTYGWIKSLGARYASVVTRDGIEYIIPNEDLITQRVENWSYSDNLVRLRIPLGVSYGSDVRQAMALCLEAAAKVGRVLKKPDPVCLLKGFGDNSVELELRIWIDDPQNGLSNVKSQILLQVWEKFRQHGIQIPFPQRDIHLKPPIDVSVRVDGPARGMRKSAPVKPPKREVKPADAAS